MSETAQIILAVSLGIVLLCAAGCLVVMTIDTIRGWKKDGR